MPQPPMPYDQTSPDFLNQLKDLAKGFLSWVSEEGNEAEHPGGTVVDQDPYGRHPADQVSGNTTPGGGAVPMPTEPSGEPTSAPALVRTRTTTVHDFADPNAPQQPVATDPPVSQAQRGAMHAAAQGNSNIGIPQSVGKEFANADPGGQLPDKKGEDDGMGGGQRFSLSPDGRQIIDNQGGKSYSIEDAMRILFSDGMNNTDAATVNKVEPAGQVTVNPPDQAEVNTAKWTVPKIEPPGKDRLGSGDGGTVLGQLLDFTANKKDDMPPRGGWDAPKFGAKPAAVTPPKFKGR